MQARVRRSTSAPSGLEYHVLTPKGMVKHLERQCRAPDHLKDFFCLDQSHRPITDYYPGVGISSDTPSQSRGVFVADSADPQDQQRCTAFNGIKSLDELINSDRPIATIQVTRFNDATLITISGSHIMGDLFTIKAVFKAWESTLHGKSPPPFEQLGRDPFSAYGPGGQLAGKDVMSNSPLLPPGWRVYGLLDKAHSYHAFFGTTIFQGRRKAFFKNTFSFRKPKRKTLSSRQSLTLSRSKSDASGRASLSKARSLSVDLISCMPGSSNTITLISIQSNGVRPSLFPTLVSSLLLV